MTHDTIRLAIVEDDRASREGLRYLAEATPGFTCVGAWGSAEEALRAIERAAPDVMTLDIHLPGMPGSEAAAVFHERCPDMAILMLTVYEEEEKVFESLCNGACGYLVKSTPPAELLEAIRRARCGGAPMSPEIAAKVIRMFRRMHPETSEQPALTAQELRLLGLLAEGHTYESAGRELNVTVNTVRNHVRSIYDKLHVHSKSAAVAKALRAGLI
ncbi:MAG: response regulator transcription factor [Acidobacteria bacterium]|nr:response regulator transcription factor [Acidobacteriota bacterium]